MAFGDQMLTTKQLPRPSMLLKDYLRDDMSSCSSSGFKSFPRRQCCTTIRLFMEKDIQYSKRNRCLFRPNKRRSSTKSALKKASEAVIDAVKLLPFPAMSTLPLSQRNKAKKGLLSRSLSRKLLSRSFWRKAAKEEATSDNRPWRSFREVLEDRDELSDQNIKTFSITKTISNTSFASRRISTSNSGSNKSKGNSWAESEFTWEMLRSSSNNWESSTENDVVEREEVTPKKEVGKRGGVTAGEESMEGVTSTTTRSLTNSREWPNEEKEQFSPVSVLDCPFEDDEDITSPYDSTSNHLQGNKHKHVQKNRRHFNRMASLEPVDLQKRNALPELEDQPDKPPTKTCPSLPISVQNDSSKLLRDKIAEESCVVEEKARDLLSHVKRSVSPKFVIMKAENLLFDFFKLSIGENIDDSEKLQLCNVAEDWINGQLQEQYLGWEVREGKQVYIREMDECGRWRISDQEKEELVLEVEVEVFTALVNELLLEFSLC